MITPEVGRYYEIEKGNGKVLARKRYTAKVLELFKNGRGEIICAIVLDGSRREKALPEDFVAVIENK